MFTAEDNTPPVEYELTAIGARRRLEALAAIGYTQTDLAELLNLERGRFAFWRFDVPPYKFRAVARLFSQLHMTPGRSERARTHAKAHGWAPPLAWDEDTIDDPDAQPEGVAPRGYWRKNRIPVDFVEIVGDHRKLGHYDEDIAKAMNLTIKALGQRLRRAGLSEHRRGSGNANHRPPDYNGRYRLVLAGNSDRSNVFAGIARRAI